MARPGQAFTRSMNFAKPASCWATAQPCWSGSFGSAGFQTDFEAHSPNAPRMLAAAPHQARHWQQAALVPNVFGFVLYRLAKKLRFVAKFGTWRPNATWFAAAPKFHDSDGGDRRGDKNQRLAGGSYDHVEQAQQNRRVPTRD